MPEPVGPGQRYVPGLDGVRAFAVAAVIAYHLGFGWASGGLLGVAVFFTLSGYLITDLLLGRYEATGSLELTRFWIHRARRLLPAVLVLLALVSAWITVFKRSELHELRGAVTAALTYVSNWWLIGRHVSYGDRFAAPSPLEHLWSLAVEEQFYLVWPWVLLGALWIVRRRRGFRAMRAHLALATLVLAALSAWLMAALFRPGFDVTRVYEGTDTRAFGLLVGAALAFVWPSHRLRAQISRGAARGMDLAGLGALAVIVFMMHTSTEYSPFLYRGGLVLLSLATAVLVACVVHPASGLNRLLGVAPLRWLGVRSYGVYLWHYPVIVLTTPVVGAAVVPTRAAGQVAVTLVLAALSWRFVEDPIRRGALGRWRRTGDWKRWRLWLRGWRAGALTGIAAVLATSCVGMSQSPDQSRANAAPPSRHVSITVTAPPTGPSTSTTPSATSPTTPSHDQSPPTVHAKHGATTGRTTHPGGSPTVPAAQATHTSCTGIVHIGDSTSEGLVSPDYISDPNQRVTARYAAVGVREQHIEISGGTSILETVNPGEQNAFQVAQSVIKRGYSGAHDCWMLALGTNDTADVAVGTTEDRATRIAKMMQLIGSKQTVVWTTVKSLRSSGPYSEANMQAWNAALLAACAKYPNMRVYDWASAVRNSWFIDDGIHFTTDGYIARASMLAAALAHAAPSNGAPSGCVVH